MRIGGISILLLACYLTGCTLYENEARKVFERDAGTTALETQQLKTKCMEWNQRISEAEFDDMLTACFVVHQKSECMVTLNEIECDKGEPELMKQVHRFFE